MAKKKKSDDVNILASQIVKEATEKPTKEKPHQKNPAAVELGRLGGLKGGKERAKRLSARRRKEIARKAAKTRWSNR